MIGQLKMDEAVLLILLVVIFVLPVVIRTIINLQDFSRERKRLNAEIKRTTGFEQKRFKRQKRRLFLSLIPFVRYY